MYQQNAERDELRARFTKWMKVTVYRARLNYLKSQERVANTISLEDLHEEQTDIYEGEIHWIAEMTATESFSFEEEYVEDAFSKLAPVKRKVITMLFLFDMTPQEIADQMGCTVQYVYKQRSLGLKKLREALEKRENHGC